MEYVAMRDMVRSASNDELVKLADFVEAERALRGYQFKVGDRAQVVGLCGGTFIVEIKSYCGSKLKVVLLSCVVPSRSRRAYIGSSWRVPPQMLQPAQDRAESDDVVKYTELGAGS